MQLYGILSFLLLGNKWNFQKFVSYQEIRNIIKEKWPDVKRLRDSANDTSKVCFL